MCAVLLAATAGGAERHALLVTASPSLDVERLADLLRTYLDGYSVDVRTAAASEALELREQLAATEAAGEGVRAIASVRVAAADASTLEIQLVDRLTKKALVTRVPRLGRDEDLYRALALKVQALLRATLSEEGSRIAQSAPALAPLVLAAAPPKPVPHRISLEVSYVLSSFPMGGLVQHGVSVLGRFEPVRLLELAIGIDALAPTRATHQDVTALLSTIPIVLSAGVHLRRPRLEGAIGGVVRLNVLVLDSESAATEVRSQRSVVPGLGVQVAGRVRIASVVWLHLRASVLGVPWGERYLVRGEPLLDASGLQVTGEAGLGVAVW